MNTLLRRSPCPGSGSARPYALRHARLIDGTGAPPRDNLTLPLCDGRIKAIQPDGPPPAGYRDVSLKGLTVLPGFINAHVHGAYDRQNLKDWLQGGVTSAPGSTAACAALVTAASANSHVPIHPLGKPLRAIFIRLLQL